jgi:hypothetical protein
MSEDLKENIEALSPEEIQEDVEAFKKEEALEEGVEFQDYHLKMVVLNVLDQRIAPLAVRRDVRGLSSAKIEKRNHAVRITREWGMPQDEQEASIAADSLSRRLEKASRTKNGSPEKAVTGTYNSAIKYWKNSKDHLDILRKVLHSGETEPEPDSAMIKDLLLRDSQFKDVYVDYFLNKENLDHYSWRKNQKARRKALRGAVVMMAEHLESSRLADTHILITNAFTHRLNFWSGQLKQANELDFVKVLRTPQSNLETLNAPRSPQEAVADSEAQETGHEIGQLAVEGNLKDDHAGVVKPVAELMEEHAKRQKEKAARWEELTDRNWLPGRVKEKLDQEFPDLRTPEEIEQLEREADAETRRQAKMSGGSHPTGPRGKKYHFDNDNARVESDRDPY